MINIFAQNIFEMGVCNMQIWQWHCCRNLVTDYSIKILPPTLYCTYLAMYDVVLIALLQNYVLQNENFIHDSTTFTPDIFENIQHGY